MRRGEKRRGEEEVRVVVVGCNLREISTHRERGTWIQGTPNKKKKLLNKKAKRK